MKSKPSTPDRFAASAIGRIVAGSPWVPFFTTSLIYSHTQAAKATPSRAGCEAGAVVPPDEGSGEGLSPWRPDTARTTATARNAGCMRSAGR